MQLPRADRWMASLCLGQWMVCIFSLASVLGAPILLLWCCFPIQRCIEELLNNCSMRIFVFYVFSYELPKAFCNFFVSKWRHGHPLTLSQLSLEVISMSFARYFVPSDCLTIQSVSSWGKATIAAKFPCGRTERFPKVKSREGFTSGCLAARNSYQVVCQACLIFKAVDSKRFTNSV